MNEELEKKGKNMKHTKKEIASLLYDAIDQYCIDLAILEDKELYETKRYTAIWHYCDGMRISYFVLTGESLSLSKIIDSHKSKVVINNGR